MSSSEFHEKFKSKDLRDFRLGTVASSDHETPLTVGQSFSRNVQKEHVHYHLGSMSSVDFFFFVAHIANVALFLALYSAQRRTPCESALFLEPKITSSLCDAVGSEDEQQTRTLTNGKDRHHN